MNVVVMGCGRVGARVSSILDNNGHRVTVIDIDRNPEERRRVLEIVRRRLGIQL